MAVGWLAPSRSLLPRGFPSSAGAWPPAPDPSGPRLPRFRCKRGAMRTGGLIEAFSGESGEQCVRHRRRECLLSSAALALLLFPPGNAHGLSQMPDLGDDSNVGSLDTVSSRDSNANVDNGQTAEDVNSWYRYRGQGFALRIPPGYEDIMEPIDEDSANTFYGDRAKDSPFAARFASPDRDEVLSVVVRQASQMKLSFLQTDDISDFGTIKEAAPTFVPGGAKLVSARIINSKAARVPRVILVLLAAFRERSNAIETILMGLEKTYYLYEFLAKDKHVALSAGVASGRVFVLGATAPESKWGDVGSRLRQVAASFYLP